MILALGLVLAAHAGAWTREQGDGYGKIAVDHFRTPGAVDPLAGPVATHPYQGTQFGFYGEIGVLRGWPVQVQGSLPLVVGTSTSTEPLTGHRVRTTAVRGGDAVVAVQAQLPVPAPMAVSLEVKAPLYANGRLGPLAPRSGDGQIDWTGWWLAGVALTEVPVWGEVALGYRHRTEVFVGWDPGEVELVDGVPFRGVLGGRWRAVVPMLSIEGLRNLREDAVTRQWLGAGTAVMLGTGGGFAVEARLGADLWARNTGRGVGGGVGVSWTPEPP